MANPTIHIPKPCHEDWSNMAASDKGRFCASCEKVVYDFTGMSDRAIVQVLNSENPGCGQFKKSQLNRNLIVQKQKSAFWTVGLTGILSFLNLGNDHLLAQAKPNTVQMDSITKVGKNAVETPEEYLISGIVFESGLPMPGAKVINLRTIDSITADFDGVFIIKAKVEDVLEFSFIGYKNAQYTVNPESQNIEIIMQPDAQTLNDTVITGGICIRKRTFFGRIFHSIGNLFQ